MFSTWEFTGYSGGGTMLVSCRDPDLTRRVGVHGGDGDYFGSRTFRAARGLANVSQRRLAKLADVDPSFIARLEKDKFGSINEETLAKLVDALKKLDVEIVPETHTEGAGVRWRSPIGADGTAS